MTGIRGGFGACFRSRASAPGCEPIHTRRRFRAHRCERRQTFRVRLLKVSGQSHLTSPDLLPEIHLGTGPTRHEGQSIAVGSPTPSASPGGDGTHGKQTGNNGRRRSVAACAHAPRQGKHPVKISRKVFDDHFGARSAGQSFTLACVVNTDAIHGAIRAKLALGGYLHDQPSAGTAHVGHCSSAPRGARRSQNPLTGNSAARHRSVRYITFMDCDCG
jgi:hypothetical protein